MFQLRDHKHDLDLDDEHEYYLGLGYQSSFRNIYRMLLRSYDLYTFGRRYYCRGW